jgi:hypothetical protein
MQLMQWITDAVFKRRRYIESRDNVLDIMPRNLPIWGANTSVENGRKVWWPYRYSIVKSVGVYEIVKCKEPKEGRIYLALTECQRRRPVAHRGWNEALPIISPFRTNSNSHTTNDWHELQKIVLPGYEQAEVLRQCVHSI